MSALRPPASQRSQAFTLVEILVVIGIIAILLAILIPAIGSARRQANTVRCLGNQRQLVTAFLLYARDHDDVIPLTGFNSPHVKQWAYDFSGGTMSGKQQDVEGGQLWQYIHNYGAYHCPQTSGPYPGGSIQNLTNYVMSGAMSAFSATYMDLKQFRPDDAVFWEVPSRGIANGANDATNEPYEGVAARHKHGTTMSHIDGHVDVVSAEEFINLFQSGPSILWADPTRTDGGIGRYGTAPTSIPIQEE